MKANMFVGVPLLTAIVLTVSMLPFRVMAAESGENDNDVFVKKFGPGKMGTLASAGLGYNAVQKPLKGFKNAAYSAGNAADALSKGKICKAVGHTIMAPVHAATGVVVGAGALIASPFPAIVGGGMAAYNGITGSKKGEQTLKMKKNDLRDLIADRGAGNKVKYVFSKKEMSQIYDRDRDYDQEKIDAELRRQLERSKSSSSYEDQRSRSSGSHRSSSHGGSRPSQSQRPSSSTTSYGGQKAGGGSSRSAGRPPTTPGSVRPSGSNSRSGSRSLSRSATARQK